MMIVRKYEWMHYTHNNKHLYTVCFIVIGKNSTPQYLENKPTPSFLNEVVTKGAFLLKAHPPRWPYLVQSVHLQINVKFICTCVKRTWLSVCN